MIYAAYEWLMHLSWGDFGLLLACAVGLFFVFVVACSDSD